MGAVYYGGCQYGEFEYGGCVMVRVWVRYGLGLGLGYGLLLGYG